MTTILFDLDGTLIDSTEAILQSFEYAFLDQNDTPRSKESIVALIGHPLDLMFEHLGVERSKVHNYVASYKTRYKELSCPMTTLLPQAKDAIELASKFATLGIVTTKTAKYSIELLKHLGVMHHFKVLIGREDVIHPKPHPEPILKAMHKLGATSQRCWMIGDTIMDINSAHKAKIKAVAVKCGYGDEKELYNYCEFVKENAYEAVKFIQRWELEQK